MPEPLRVCLLTGDHPRHMSFCRAAAGRPGAEIVGHVIMQRENLLPKPPAGIGAHLEQLWHTHFQRRDDAERRHFGGNRERLPGAECLTVTGDHELNEGHVVDFVRGLRADMALIFGVGIIRDPLFSELPPHRVNLHLGLIPEYKGSITMFWPFYFLEPTMAGCTYHVIGPLVDTGRVLHQVVPTLCRGDGMHDVACKACLAAFDDLDLVLEAVADDLRHDVVPEPDPRLARTGKLFRKSDFRPTMLRVNYELFDDDVVDHYLDGRLPARLPQLTRLPLRKPARP